VRLGVMIGAERGDSARKVTKLLADIEWAEAAGMDTAWIPQVPNDFDALLAVALMGTRATRIELGTAVVPLQAQHPIALARQALSTHAATGGRLALGVGPSHHWIIQDMLGLPYERPAAYTRDYLEVLHAAFSGPGSVDVENEHFTVHNPNDLAPVAPLPVLVAALGPVTPTARCCGWLTSGPSPSMWCRGSPRPLIMPAGLHRESSPAYPCVCVRQAKSIQPASGPTGSSAKPRCHRTINGCSTTATPAM
jgi:alkanesulfonate monooxygenase SsuD/methylene tetrahydromethanopterin reductase-like flavin-dependent oxidoreductase (luciferase family)